MLGLLFILVVSFYAIAFQINASNALKKQIIKINEDIETEKRTYAELKNELDYYNTDAYIEKTARKRLQLVKPNEILFINKAK